MIKVGEVRCGNMFRRNHGKGWTDMIFDETMIGKIFSSDPEFALDDFDPVPLTADLLVAAGFKLTMIKMRLVDYIDYRLGNCVASVITSGVEIEYCGSDIEERTYICKINFLPPAPEPIHRTDR